MLHRLILKITKCQVPPPKSLGTVGKNILGAIMCPPPPCQLGLKVNLDDVKHIEKDKPDIKSEKEYKQDIEMIKTKPYMNEITYEEEIAALILIFILSQLIRTGFPAIGLADSQSV